MPAQTPVLLTVLPAMTTVLFQFGIGLLFVVTLVIAVPAAIDCHESPSHLHVEELLGIPAEIQCS